MTMPQVYSKRYGWDVESLKEYDNKITKMVSSRDVMITTTTTTIV
jgi:hypothetical protein